MKDDIAKDTGPYSVEYIAFSHLYEVRDKVGNSVGFFDTRDKAEERAKAMNRAGAMNEEVDDEHVKDDASNETLPNLPPPPPPD